MDLQQIIGEHPIFAAKWWGFSPDRREIISNLAKAAGAIGGHQG